MIKYITVEKLGFKREEGSCTVEFEKTGHYPVYMNYKLKKHLYIAWDNESFECSLCDSKQGSILIRDLTIEQVTDLINQLKK